MKSTICLFTIMSLAAPARAIVIDTVPVGNPGNPDHLNGSGSNHGAVAYSYRIGKYEVTNTQYVEFLNLADPTGTNSLSLYNSLMTTNTRGGILFESSAANGSKDEIKPGRANNPVVYVSWYDSVRFTNWLHNGATAGADTEHGAYELGPLAGGAVPIDGTSVARKPNATWFLPDYDEWYKAAFHKNNGPTSEYWNYPTRSNSTPYSDAPAGEGTPEASNSANFYKADGLANGYDDGYAVSGTTSQVFEINYLTNAGAYTQAIGPYGTFDQGGNVFEWIETLAFGSNRLLQGGAWTKPDFYMSESDLDEYASFENQDVGFRVATVPEPSTMLSALAGIAWFLAARRHGHAVLVKRSTW